MKRDSTRTPPRPFAGLGRPHRNDLASIYFVVGAWTAALVIVSGAVAAVLFDVPGLWLTAIVSSPTLIDKLYRLTRRPSRSLTLPLLLDSTTIGLGGLILGLAPLVVGYGLLMLTIVALLTGRGSYRVLFPYVGVWMGAGLYFSVFSEPILGMDPVVGQVLVAIHVPLTTAGTMIVLSRMMGRLRQSEATRSRIVGGLVHDMKNAMTGAVGMAELLSDHLEDLTPAEIKEYAALVLSEGQSVVAMTDDLLTMERADAGRLEISTQRVDVWQEIHAVLVSSGHDSDIAIEVSGSSDRPVALGDPGRVRQIVRNLVSNAKRHGGEEVRISMETTDSHVFIRVSDNGAAIPESEQSRMFKPYESARHRPRHADSIGLGLSMSREIAQLMGGDLTYENTLGWSVFELTLSAARSAASDDEGVGDVQVTQAEQVWLGSDGMVHGTVHPGRSVTLDDAIAGIDAYVSVTGGVRRPILINLENMVHASLEARSYYVNNPATAEWFSAVALVVQEAPIARFLAQHLVSLMKPPVPVRLFEDEPTALAWLGRYLPATQSP